jgi:hypothetical protein
MCYYNTTIYLRLRSGRDEGGRDGIQTAFKRYIAPSFLRGYKKRHKCTETQLATGPSTRRIYIYTFAIIFNNSNAGVMLYALCAVHIHNMYV